MKIEDWMLPCPSKKFFGLECFGCGTQRAVLLVFRGDFAEAFYMFPAVYTLLLFLLFCVLNLIDRSRNYSKILIICAIINSLIMVFSYFYKQYFIYLN